jgi:subtilisin
MFIKTGMAQKILLFFTMFIIIGMTNGCALAADHNVIIGFHQSNITEETNLVHDNGGKLKKTFHLITAVSANMSDENISKLKKDSRIAYIVNDSIFQAADEYTSAWGVKYIGSQPVHSNNIIGAGVKIAVLDTGIDYTHPDLKDNYKGGFDFVNNDSDPWDDNCLSYYKTCHGTHVSGTIAAELNGFGVVGVAPGASIYAAKVLDGGGFGAASLVVSGLEWAVNNKMNIASMSLESTENNTAVLDAVNAAYDSGVLLVAAAGNTNGKSVLYPAAYDSVIAVTAIDQNDQRAVFSPIDSKIELAAPGVNVNSTICMATQANTCLTEGYGLLNGTSMAAPHVTGVAALVLSLDMTKTNKEVRTILQNTARHVGDQGRNNVYGFGVVDASNATLGIPTYPPIPPDTTPPVITLNGSNPVNITVGSTYTDAGAVAVDTVDGSVTVVVTGAVNTTVVGTYIITYTATDKAGNEATATRTVNVISITDTTPPVITLNGSNPVNITVGSTYTDAGAVAIDAVDGSVAVVMKGSVNTKKAGTYIITYTATDKAGNVAIMTRTVNVVKPVLTTITVSPSSVTVPRKSSQIFTAIAKDQLDNPMKGIVISWSSSVASIGTVNPVTTITGINGQVVTKFTASAGKTGQTIVTARSGTISDDRTVYEATVSVSPTYGAVFGYATVIVTDISKKGK